MGEHALQRASPPTLEGGPALICVLGAQMLSFLWVLWTLALPLPSDSAATYLIVTNWLWLGLAVAWGVWALAVTRGWVTAATGGGFAIAAHGLLLRGLGGYLLLHLPSLETPPPAPASYPPLLAVASATGLPVFGVGMALVIVATVSERRSRRAAERSTATL